jgi:hypothetical protein
LTPPKPILVVSAIAATVAAIAIAPQAADAVTLNWVGDIAVSTSAGLPRDHGRSLFAGVEPLLRGTDVTLGNLEGTLGAGGSSKCSRIGGSCFAFQAPTWFATTLRRAGFQLVNMANNHSHDYGRGGILATVAALGAAHLAQTGLRGEITVRRVAGTRGAFLGFAPYPWTSDLLNIPAARQLVRRARRRARIVVVLIHAGAEGPGALHTPRGPESDFGESRGDARRFAHAVVDAGAALVLGSGPHVIRGLDCYRHRLIAYSLGDFVGYRTLAIGGVLSLSAVLHVTLSRSGAVVSARWRPVVIVAPGVPRRDRSGASTRLVRRLSRDDFGHAACRVDAAGAIRVR